MECAWRLKALLVRQQQQQQQQQRQRWHLMLPGPEADQQQQQQQQPQGGLIRASLPRCVSLAAASSAATPAAAAAAATAARELECLYFDYERSSNAFIRALLVLQPLQILSPLLLRLNFNGFLATQARGGPPWGPPLDRRPLGGPPRQGPP
ncbi:hypothetical protein ETH_00041520 [Eimeria tenella]|uniref:Uncharacterized protein n=1 Tax=Eimeria tenella TaxID=5802 RepID=U6L1I7_EIMTE|nr:hypothetical protein ETH_00041520 [Eimeria tenella]CDJ44277.1 hypothetical protein ETH_00041520 [Eimeria tenella]|eukprot:XP_013235026.1 hypothetical protein ETH_00041520 [Eimeria tenella]